MNQSQTVELPNMDEERKQSNALSKLVKQLKITSIDELKTAESYVKTVSKGIKDINEKYKAPLKAANDLCKSIRSMKDGDLDLPNRMKSYLDKMILEFRRQEMQKQIEEQKKAEALERKRLAENKKNEEKRILEEASDLEVSGLKEEASMLVDKVVNEVSTPVSVVLPKKQIIPKSSSYVKKTWRFEIIDPSKVNQKFLIPNEQAIGSLVRGMGLTAADIVGGIRVYQDETLVTRAS